MAAACRREHRPAGTWQGRASAGCERDAAGVGRGEADRGAAGGGAAGLYAGRKGGCRLWTCLASPFLELRILRGRRILRFRCAISTIGVCLVAAFMLATALSNFILGLLSGTARLHLCRRHYSPASELASAGGLRRANKVRKRRKPVYPVRQDCGAEDKPFAKTLATHNRYSRHQ